MALPGLKFVDGKLSLNDYYGKTYCILTLVCTYIIVLVCLVVRDTGISWLEIYGQKALFDYYDNT